MADLVVIDASAALQYLAPDNPERAAQVDELFELVASGEWVAHVPGIFCAEVAAGAIRIVRSKRASLATARQFLGLVNALPLRTEFETLTAAQHFERAQRWSMQVADAAYLTLAVEMGAWLAATDGGMLTAARAQKVQLLWPHEVGSDQADGAAAPRGRAR